MNDAVLQVLLILAFLAIGLISVTFPVYAISVNFLPKQKWEDEKERKKRMDDIQAKIEELTRKLGTKGVDTETIKEQLDKYKAEKEGTELKYRYLTALGAVGVPIGFLISALIFAGIGIYGFVVDSEQGVAFWGGGSAVLSFLAIFRLYKTISAVEYGALKPERTVTFEAGFGKDYEKTKTIKLNEPTTIDLVVRTTESDTDSLYVMASFPSELGITMMGTAPGLVISEYKECTLIRIMQDYLPKGFGIGFTCSATPKKIGKHTIDVFIRAKGVYEYDEHLPIEVV